MKTSNTDNKTVTLCYTLNGVTECKEVGYDFDIDAFVKETGATNVVIGI